MTNNGLNEMVKTPEVKFNKNGYEIRTEVLSMAKDLVGQDFHYKYMGWELTAERDKDGKVITKVAMPDYPGIEKVLEAAEKMYAFVNTGAKK
jgi:hypothetical protein